MHFTKMLPRVAIAAIAAAALLTPIPARADDDHNHGRPDDGHWGHTRADDGRWPRDARLEGRTYDRMRQLAHELDDRAQHVADQSINGAHHGDRSEGRFLDAVTHFARQAADFHERMDRYRESPWDIPAEVDHIIQDARRVNVRIHNAHVFEHTWDDWDAAIGVLNEMQRIVGGARDYGSPRDYGSHRFSFQWRW